MQIIRAKTAGFCFGVARAVDMTYSLLAGGTRVATLGPLIHNHVHFRCTLAHRLLRFKHLARRGVVAKREPDDRTDVQPRKFRMGARHIGRRDADGRRVVFQRLFA